MYCLTCDCEYEGWTGNCPNCKNPLDEGVPPLTPNRDQYTSYESLIDLVQKKGGSLTIDVKATEISKSRSTRFPWLGYGYAWLKRMRGVLNGITVDLSTSKVGRDRKWAFPYQGHGYAWHQEMQGLLAGQEISLTAKKVKKVRKWSFPYFGYGYAWTEIMSGVCGEKLNLELVTTNVGKSRRTMFPYFGFGYAWVNNATLTVTLVE